MPAAPPQQVQRLLRLSEVAQILGTSRNSVRQLIADGELRTVRFGSAGWHRIRREDVEAFIRGKEDGP